MKKNILLEIGPVLCPRFYGLDNVCAGLKIIFLTSLLSSS